MEFSREKNSDGDILHSRTSDGLDVDLEISFQYMYIPKYRWRYDFPNLSSLYAKYKNNYPHIIKNMAIDVIADTATKYSAYDFFMDR